MKSLLVINSSGRINRSVTRKLTARFAEKWLLENPGGEVIDRDVGTRPPTFLNESWIAAAYIPEESRTPEGVAALEESEVLIREIERADAIVIAAPLYNFGMPAPLKAYFEQIVRVGRTFAFNADPANPYEALLRSRPVTVITATAGGGYEPGGANAAINFLEPHLRVILKLVGLDDLSLVRVAFQGTHEEYFQASLTAAEQEIDRLVARLADEAPDQVREPLAVG